MSKESIFISHATPEDNDFTRWLGAKLTLHGYRVWHDLDRLKGGDIFWDKIEKAIREESFRMLAVVSQISYAKQGVRNEWELGVTVEKAFPGFVIPIRIDSFDFSLLPITMHRKNVIDFAGGWHKGLVSLLDTLAEVAAPKSDVADPVFARQWLAGEKINGISLLPNQETLESNWIPISSLPPSIESARILSDARRIPLTKINSQLPWFEFGDRIFGFAPSYELVSLLKDSVMLKAASAIDCLSFVNKGQFGEDNKVSINEARYRVESLVRQAWELAMEKAGLKLYMLSGARPIYYVPANRIPGGKVPFTDADGKVKKRGLNGRSERRKVNWHYGVGIRPSLDTPWRIELKATIVFTGDDGEPVDPARAQRLRMSFCRSWWNDRWRGFMHAFLAYISNGKKELALPVGYDRFIVISTEMMTFSSPVSLSDKTSEVEDEPILDVDDDSTDWDDLEDDDEEVQE